jgi:hypothetical protein
MKNPLNRSNKILANLEKLLPAMQYIYSSKSESKTRGGRKQQASRGFEWWMGIFHLRESSCLDDHH